ncbi:hypothetical protein O181_009673 [Austropuccinia psidii MF-1]|uniref:Uncharacterized protein n=1 Tax=Austropuccinia psidii MF-1 TaxID=1389203 RepID=A0A9Q3GJN4_9BASI|nr:hypothetical protein [Austropuccinia psidii MF-1]
MHPSTSREHWAKNSERVNEYAEESRLQISLEKFPDLVKESKPGQTKSENNYSSDSNEPLDHGYKPNSKGKCLVPAPNPPNTSTIKNILKPLVDELLKRDQTINIQTFQVPIGRNSRIVLAELIGDIVPTHKLSGFESHSAHWPCTWCEVIKKDLEKVMIGKNRNKHDTLGLSVRWLNEKEIRQHKILVKKTGVRWSELNHLP